MGPELETTIFYMDMRTHGKDFEKYYERVQELGGRFIRSRVHSFDPLPGGDVKVNYGTEEGEFITETFDMVVLSVGLESGDGHQNLARELGVDLSRYHLATELFTPVTTSRPGIYACGVFTGPKDIPQSVQEGRAAAAAVAASSG